MKKVTISSILLFLVAFVGISSANAQSDRALTMFKNHINGVVEKVETAETPDQKRAILNNSFDKLQTSFNRVENMRMLSEADQTSLNAMQANIAEKQNELNGQDGFRRVPDNQLNNFANFVQQDLEQADSTITISVTVLLLIIIILLLL